MWLNIYSSESDDFLKFSKHKLIIFRQQTNRYSDGSRKVNFALRSIAICEFLLSSLSLRFWEEEERISRPTHLSPPRTNRSFSYLLTLRHVSDIQVFSQLSLNQACWNWEKFPWKQCYRHNKVIQSDTSVGHLGRLYILIGGHTWTEIWSLVYMLKITWYI